MLLKSFPQFQSLPTDVRTYTWRMALRQPRFHRLRITGISQGLPFTLQATETLGRSSASIRSILETCAESRKEALRAVPDQLPLGDYILRFNGHEDVICLVHLDLAVIQELNATVQKHGGSDLANTGIRHAMDFLREVEKLAFEVRDVNCEDDIGVYPDLDDRYLLQFMTLLPNLKWLFLVPVPSPDNMKTVKRGKKRLGNVISFNQWG